MSKLGAIAQMLRSDCLNEREIAVRKIESMTGMSMKDIILTGSPRITRGDAAGWIMNHARIKSGDDMIIAVTSELSSIGSDWNDLVEAGSRQTTTAGASDAFEAMQGIFDSFMANYHSSAAPAQAKAEPARPVRVGSADLPAYAVGVPYISRSGVAKTGNAYAIVSFSQFTGPGDTAMKPIIEFIAFGDEWVEEIRQAEEEGSEILVAFGENRTPGRHVPIIKGK